ncbi:MAG: S-methyl-5-thioribose-1-phosphate isomerase [Spirochaetes bacterium]|nr:S-methyl-5-thioribose-1-phosphate isomerase [Spirochaetota bacterium]
MKVNGKDYRTVWMEGSVIKMIDQALLPHRFNVIDIKNLEELKKAINDMNIRGAGAIGAAGGYGIAQAALQANDADFFAKVNSAADELKRTRPTAQNLFTVIDGILKKTAGIRDTGKAREETVKEAQYYADLDAESCRKIGMYGAGLIKDGAKVSTHCNAGWLAFVDWGSALSPVYYAVKEEKKNVFVYVDETRPRCQGANLTAWELLQEKIPHTIIADNVTGALMWKGKIDLVIVGADRIARNGDVANKIGTYSSAVAAKENGIPFYVAAPITTIDPNCESGKSIPIEERNQDETLYMYGINDSGNYSRVRIAPEGCTALNIGFDVTPAEYIKGIITEKGIFQASEKGVEEILKGSINV